MFEELQDRRPLDPAPDRAEGTRAPAGGSARDRLRGLDHAAQAQALAPALQASSPDGMTDAATHERARAGTAGPGGALPHLDRIQQAFGRHDVSGVRGHVGGAAAGATAAMGADAFAFGSHVAFQASPDLRTAAHEAAHVVQQRAGVSLHGGVGEVGDPYERHADAVADAVVGGRSAEPLLDRVPGGGGGGGGAKVQHWKPGKVKPRDRSTRYTPDPELKVTVARTLAMRNEWYDAAIQILQEAMQDGTVGQEKHFSMRHLAFALEREKAKGAGVEGLDENVIATERLQEIFDVSMPGRLSVMIEKTLGVSRQDAVLRMRETYIRMKNSQPWQTIQRTIAMRNDGGVGTSEVTSTLTPVNHYFHETYDKDWGVEGKRFGGSGLSSMSPRLALGTRNQDTETKRPTNLWHSTLTDDQGKLLFEAFRSGAFSDVAVKDPGMQAQVGTAKATQVLEAMLIHRLGQVTDHQQLWRYLKGEDVYRATVISINLLTEAKALGFGDKTAAQQHHAAIQSVSGQELVYSIKFRLPWAPGQLYSFNPKAVFKVIDFGAGVNVAGGKVGFGGAQKNQLKRNKESMRALKEHFATWQLQVDQKMQTLQQEQNGENYFDQVDRMEDLRMRKEQARALMAKIKDKGITHAGDYKLPVLLANLANLMGDLVHYNCKSGKDRTGLMDAKSKHLAYELEAQRRGGGDTATVPRQSRRTDDQEYRHQQMLWESGNLQVLERNVGGQSLKVGDLSGLPWNKDRRLRDDLGGKKALRELQGLKRYTNIDHGMEPGKHRLLIGTSRASRGKDKRQALDEMRKMLEETRHDFQVALLQEAEDI